MDYKKGFTLIELLVVIAIIGLLSSIVLAALNQSREKSIDASIQQSMVGIRNAAEIWYDNLGQSYTNVGKIVTNKCDEELPANSAGTILEDAGIQNSIYYLTNLLSSTGDRVTCNINTNVYAISTPLKTGGHWCIDSTGASRKINATLVVDTDYACPAS